MFIILIDFLSIFLQDSLGLNLFVCLLFLYVDFFLFVTCQQYYREIDHSMISRIVSRQFEVYKGQGHKPSVHGQLVVIHIIPQYYWHVVLQILSKFHRKRRGRLNENKMDQKRSLTASDVQAVLRLEQSVCLHFFHNFLCFLQDSLGLNVFVDLFYFCIVLLLFVGLSFLKIYSSLFPFYFQPMTASEFSVT